MRAATTKQMLGIALVVTLAACGGKKDPQLININRGLKTPDEFAILPNKPLELPDVLPQALPAPTPGGGNRVDPSPQKDAVEALGGNPDRLTPSGQLRGEAGLINHTTRFGVDGSIRERLAAEDLAFRKKNDGRLLEKLFNVTVYYRAYRKQSLDQHRELLRFRRAGVKTPSAPPEVKK